MILRSRAAGLAALALLAALTGCSSRRSQQGCRMETEVVIAASQTPPSTVAVTRSHGGAYLAAWSADDETWAAELNPQTLRVAWKQRVERYPTSSLDGLDGGEPKTFWPDGGRANPDAEDLAVVATAEDRLALALLERPAGALPGGALLAVLGRIPGSESTVIRLGPTGPFASRITAAGRENALYVAWHEGHPDVSRVRLASVDGARGRLLHAGVVPGDQAQSGPALAANRNAVLLAWIRTRHVDGAPRSEVRVAALGPDLALGQAATAASCRYLDPAPHLTALGDRFGLVYRDDADRDDKPEFYFAVLDAAGKVVKGPARISRADGFQGPNIAGGDPLVFSAAIRSFQRNYLVGLNRFDLAGVKRGGEFQVYADKSDFVRVALVASGQEVVLVYGEDRRGEGRVLASRVNCRDGETVE